MKHVHKKNKRVINIPSRYKNIYVLILLTILSAAVTAQDFIINTTNDTHAVTPSSSALDAGGHISLRSAIEASTSMSGAHVITFNATVATAGSIDLTLGQITVGSATHGNNITVTGPGIDSFIVNQTTAARIFSTGAGAITFKIQDIALNYTGPATTYSGGGGAIIAGGASASTILVNCKITNFRNQVGNGGAVSASSPSAHSLTVTNCIFTDNACGGTGGAISYNGIGTAAITSTTFYNDSTGIIGANSGGGGGALSFSGTGNGGTYTVSTCTFINNTVKSSTAQGGAIINTNGTLTARYNRFIGNSAITPSFGNTVAQVGGSTINTILANDNWWGINTGPAANDAVALAAGATITLNTWLQLRNIPADVSLCPSGGGRDTTLLTADILGRNSGGPVDAANLVGLAPFPSPAETIFTGATFGTLSGADTLFINGIAKATYTAGSAGGSGSVIAAADSQAITSGITIPLPPVITPVSSSVCQGSPDNIVNGPAEEPTYAWAISGGTITSETGIQNITYTAGDTSTVVLRLTITNGIGCTLADTTNVTASITNTLSGTAGGTQVCRSFTVSSAGSMYTDESCNPIARLVPSGAEPVSGTVNTCVIIDASVQETNLQPYVQRHYDITPTAVAGISPDISTATLTLYFTQEEFDNFNVAKSIYPPLPTGPGDISGIANLKVTQYHGTGTAPGNYSGAAVLIDPADSNIIWNDAASRWEVTFDVAGFSGFYVSTVTSPLPLVLLNFSGQNRGAQNLLEWTTAGEINSSYYELERSTDGYTYAGISKVLPTANSNSNQTYHYTDNVTNALPVYYYRLKIVSKDGQASYSPVARIRINNKEGFSVEVSPNPFREALRVNIETAQDDEANIILSDISGKVLRHETALLKKGTNAISLDDVKKYANGMYLLTISTSLQKQTIKVIKE